MKHNYFIVESGSKREQMYCYGDMTKPGLHSFSWDSKYTLHYSPIEKIEYVLIERHSLGLMQKATSFWTFSTSYPHLRVFHKLGTVQNHKYLAF